MVPVPVTVRLVDVEVFHALLEPAIIQVPDPTAIVRVLLLLEDTAALAPVKDTLYIPASNVPLVKVMASEELLFDEKASCRVTDPPGVSIVNGVVNTTPALVIV